MSRTEGPPGDRQKVTREAMSRRMMAVVLVLLGLAAVSGPIILALRADRGQAAFGDAEVVVFGMGRVGTGAYEAMRARHGEAVVGMDHDAEVVYGDTDSVMVKFGVQTVQEAMTLGLDAAERISETF